jgi:protein TonB
MADLYVPVLSVPEPRQGRAAPRRPWLEIALIVSALMHALLLAIVILARLPVRYQQPEPEAPGFEMVFQGGVKSPDAVPAPGRVTEIPKGQPIPAPPETAAPNAEMSPPQAAPAPEVNLLPPELQFLAPPAPQPDQQAALQATRQERTKHVRPRTSPNVSPFAHPREFSFASRPSPLVTQGIPQSKSLELSLQRPIRGGELTDGALHFTTPGVDGSYEERLEKYVEENKYYPEQAVENGEQGISVISATITRDGHVKGVRLITSSGSPWLDMAWVGLFRSMRLPPFPADMKVPELEFTYSMEYTLIGH